MNIIRDGHSSYRAAIERAHEDNGGVIWGSLASALEERPQPDETGAAEGTGLWYFAKDNGKYSEYKPKTNNNFEIATIKENNGNITYMLRNTKENKYISLGEKELFVWNLLDGENTVKDINMVFLDEYGFLGDRIIFNLLYLLRINGFLLARSHTMEQILATRLNRPSVLMRIKHAAGFFVHSNITTRRADGVFAWLYHRGGYLLYNRVFFAFAAAMLVASLFMSAYYVFVLRQPILLVPGEASSRDVVIFMLVSYISLAIHESAHGLTVKHYGRQVLKGGFVVLLGYPIAYVDTTDVWMTGKGPRIAVSFAGPFINGVLGGALLLSAWFMPEGFLSYLLHKAGLLNSLLFVANLLPILETDGHYIIQDWCERPRLRTEALAFVKKDAWLKLARREKWDKMDFVFLAYGLIAVGGIIYLLTMGIHLWFSTMQYVGKAITARPVMAAEILFFLVGMTLLMVWAKAGSFFKEPRDIIERSLQRNLLP